MKCVSIVYKRPSSQIAIPQLVPIRSAKRSVDQYLQKLKEKQQHQKFQIKTQTKLFRSQIHTAQTSRLNKFTQHAEMPDSINICKMKYSPQNIFKQSRNPQFEDQKRQKKFRSTFVKRKQSKGLFSFKGFKTPNQTLFDDKTKLLFNNHTFITKNASKVLNLKRLKLAKPNTIIISVDFILNQTNFWQQEKIDENAHKNWKILQQHSNIIWLTRREGSLRKLQKYAAQHGLRLDGVYKIMPSKKQQSLVVSLSAFEKDFRMQSQVLKMKQLKREIILINSLKVDQIKDIGYKQFYNSFPVLKSLGCIIHFVQVDMNDKYRFNSPLKILSKQKLPLPNSVVYLFRQFYSEHQIDAQKSIQSYLYDINNITVEQQQNQISKQEMMVKYEQVKQQFVNYFGNLLKVNLNKKLKIDNESQCSLQYLIGDMLKRNFNIMYGYQKQCVKIKYKLQKIRDKDMSKNKQIINKQMTRKNFNSNKEDNNQWIINNNRKQNNFIRNSLYGPNLIKNNEQKLQQLIKSKLINQNDMLNNYKINNHILTRNRTNQNKIQQNKLQQNKLQQNKFYYKDPVFLWKK